MKQILVLIAVGVVALLVTQNHLNALAAAPGAVYTRWGHKSCPWRANLVYTGYGGGSYYNHYGGAAEYLCLPKNPILVPNRYSYKGGLLFGAEYEFFGRGRHNRHQHDAPCAVCQSRSRQHVIMLPARNICPRGWHREYYGRLMSGHYDERGPSQYICVDSAMRAVYGGHANKNGKLLAPVSTVCGSLQCPPYKNNHLLTCAVCTR